MTRYLTNFTAQAIEEFATSPDDAPEESLVASTATGPSEAPPPAPAKATKQTKAAPPPPAPVASQGEPPPLTMGS